MEEWGHSSVLVDDDEQGLERVKKGGYALIWEASINEYTQNHDCQTMVVGDVFGSQVGCYLFEWMFRVILKKVLFGIFKTFLVSKEE